MSKMNEGIVSERLGEAVEKKFEAVGEALKATGNDLRTRVASAEKHLHEQADSLSRHHAGLVDQLHAKVDGLSRHVKIQYLVLAVSLSAVIAAVVWL